MSTPIFLLLSFLCLGTLEAFEPLASVGSDDGSMFYAKSFVDDFRNAFKNKDQVKLASMFEMNFSFQGCKRSEGKKSFLEMLDKIADKGVSFEYMKSYFVDDKETIYLHVSVTGLGKLFSEIEFIIYKPHGTWILSVGQVTACMPTFFARGSARSFVLDSADSIAKSFLAHFQIDIASGDANKIAKRFSESFLFHGCHGDYNKQKVLGLLASIPAGSKASMTFKSAEFVNGKDVQYTVVADGFGRPAFEAQFVLHKESGDYVLIGGKVPSCPASRFFLADSAETIAKSFLNSFTTDIASGDASKLAKRISDNFLFKGCHAEYTKQKLLSLFASVPKGSKVFLTFESAQFVNGKDVQYTVTADGLGRPAFEAQFIIHQENGKYVLIGGKVPICPKRHFNSLMSNDDPDVIARTFVRSMISLINERDFATLSTLFSYEFFFYGCHTNYNRGQFVDFFGHMPVGDKVLIKVMFAQWNSSGTEITYDIIASGFSSQFDGARFVLRSERGKYVLIRGVIPRCIKPRFIYYSY